MRWRLNPGWTLTAKRGRAVIQKLRRHYSRKTAPTESRHFLDPYVGEKAIFDYWSEVARTEEDIKFRYEILVANAELNIARWSASFVIVRPGYKLSLMESS
jgi:hypothetical protein